MIVCIAEKPSVAQDIARILGANQRKEGYFEGNGYQVTWTFGHLCELKEPHEYHPEWKRWSDGVLPMIPERFGIKLKDDKGIEKQFHIIETLYRQADSIVNCGDAGQEGELIQRWVMQKAGVKCPVRRLWISSLTEESIRNGFSNLKLQTEFQHLYEAGLCRAIGDWLLGMNATRLYTLRFGQNKSVLSIGRVQTPTLAMIVKRQLEIENFRPEPYWELKTTYREASFSATKGRFGTKEEGEELLKRVQQAEFEVTEITIKKGNESAPRLYDLTGLQVDCNKKFGFSADETLRLIQALYEKKVTTYPRVDTTYLSDDIYPKVTTIMNGMRSYHALMNPLRGKKLPKSKKVFDNTKVTDHHAIIPTGVENATLSENERKVYDMVARRFIAVFYPDCIISTTTVLGLVLDVEFKATGKQILSPGWRAVYGSVTEQRETDTDRQEENVLPTFVKGECGPHVPELIERMTTPPKPYTEATLLRAMETAGKMVENEELREVMKVNGIGRPSTRAAIIETLYRRRYIRKERKSISATRMGVELIETIQDSLLKSPELTGQWEKKLREIERGTYSATQFMEDLKEMVREVVVNGRNTSYRQLTIEDQVEKQEVNKKATKQKAVKKKKSEEKKKPKNKTIKIDDSWIGRVCPKCRKGRILKGRTAYGCSEWKNGCDWRVKFQGKSKVG